MCTCFLLSFWLCRQRTRIVFYFWDLKGIRVTNYVFSHPFLCGRWLMSEGECFSGSFLHVSDSRHNKLSKFWLGYNYRAFNFPPWSVMAYLLAVTASYAISHCICQKVLRHQTLLNLNHQFVFNHSLLPVNVNIINLIRAANTSNTANGTVGTDTQLLTL